MFDVIVVVIVLSSAEAKNQLFHLGLGPHLPSVDLSFNSYNHNPLNNIVNQFLHQNNHHQGNSQGFQHWPYHPFNVLHPSLLPISGSGSGQHQEIWKPYKPPPHSDTPWSPTPTQESSTDSTGPETDWNDQDGDIDYKEPQQDSEGGQSSEVDIMDENGCKNDLEALVNKERSRHGLSALHCDDTMRWVAQRHTDNLIKNNPATATHSWLGELACDYHAHPECMWSKPKV